MESDLAARLVRSWIVWFFALLSTLIGTFLGGARSSLLLPPGPIQSSVPLTQAVVEAQATVDKASSGENCCGVVEGVLDSVDER